MSEKQFIIEFLLSNLSFFVPKKNGSCSVNFSLPKNKKKDVKNFWVFQSACLQQINVMECKQLQFKEAFLLKFKI